MFARLIFVLENRGESFAIDCFLRGENDLPESPIVFIVLPQPEVGVGEKGVRGRMLVRRPRA